MVLPLCPRRTGQDVGRARLEGELGRLLRTGPAAAEPHPARGLQRNAADLVEIVDMRDRTVARGNRRDDEAERSVCLCRGGLDGVDIP